MRCSACFQLFCCSFHVHSAQSLHSTPHFLILHLSHSLYVYHHLHKLKLTGYRSVEYLTHSSLLYAFLVLHFLLRGQIELTPSLGICLIKVMHNPARGRERERGESQHFATTRSLPPCGSHKIFSKSCWHYLKCNAMRRSKCNQCELNSPLDAKEISSQEGIKGCAGR